MCFGASSAATVPTSWTDSLCLERHSGFSPVKALEYFFGETRSVHPIPTMFCFSKHPRTQTTDPAAGAQPFGVFGPDPLVVEAFQTNALSSPSRPGAPLWWCQSRFGSKTPWIEEPQRRCLFWHRHRIRDENPILIRRRLGQVTSHPIQWRRRRLRRLRLRGLEPGVVRVGWLGW